MQLQAGQNTALTGTRLALTIAAGGVPAGLELDVTAFLLLDSGKVPGDEGMVFYGQTATLGGAVTLDVNARRFDLDLSRLPEMIAKIAVTITIDKGTQRQQRFAQLGSVEVSVEDGGEAHRFAPDVQAMSETALILAEVYRRNGQWKLRAVGQGFNGGLAPLAQHFGVDISDDAESLPAAAPAEPAPAPPPPPPAPAAPTVNLSKITLEKSRPVNLKKADAAYGEIIVNLRWNKGRSILSKGIDLDLGAMVELVNGDRWVVQALGNSFGDLGRAPWVKLMGDDRTGASGDGEFLHINGDRWLAIKRVLIFAFIYEGARNWAKADGSVRIKVPGQPELEAHLDSPNNSDMMCAIAMLENADGEIRATKHVDYYPGHREMDAHFGFGFRWTAGHK